MSLFTCTKGVSRHFSENTCVDELGRVAQQQKVQQLRWKNIWYFALQEQNWSRSYEHFNKDVYNLIYDFQ